MFKKILKTILISLFIIVMPTQLFGFGFESVSILRLQNGDIVPRNPNWETGTIHFDNVKYVRNDGATPIQDTIDSITDASFLNRYAVVLDAGYFSETVTLPPFIDLVGQGVNWNTTINRVNVYWTAGELEVGAIKNVQIEIFDVDFQNASYVKGIQLQGVLFFNTSFTGVGQNNNEVGGHIIALIGCVAYSNPVFNGGLFVDTEGGAFATGATFNSDTIFQSNNSVLQQTYTLSDTAQAFIRSSAIGAFPESNKATFIAPSGTILNIDGVSFSTADTTQVSDDALELQDGVSAGVIEPKYTFTDNQDGTGTITDFSVFLYNNNNQKGKPRRYSVSGDDLTFTNNSANFVSVDFNNGSPQLRLDTSNPANSSDIIGVLQVYREDNELHYYELNTVGEGLANKIEERQLDISKFERASGLLLSESATRVVELTSGRVYSGASPITLIYASSTASTYEQYGHVAGVYTKNPNGAQTQYNNFYYDDGTDLVEALPNQYVVNWIYRDVDDDAHLFEVFGSNDYLTVALAQLESSPSSLPTIISNNAILVGRIIVQKNASSGVVESAFAETFTSSQVTNHNDLAGIQGGTTNQYYHLSLSENTEATQYATSTLNGLLTSSDWTIFNNKIANLVEDTTPQLGGDLASNGFDILMADNDKVIFGTGSDLEIYSDGTDSIIRNLNQDEDTIFYVNNSGIDTEVMRMDGSTGFIGIGGIETDGFNLLEVERELTTETGQQRAAYLKLKINNSTTSAVIPQSFRTDVVHIGAGDMTGIGLGFQANIINDNSGTMATGRGSQFASQILGSGNITNVQNLFVSRAFLAPSSSGSITNLYGVYIQDLTTPIGSGSGSITNAWGLYAEGSNLNHYIEGNLGLGNSSPSFKLDVNGDFGVQNLNGASQGANPTVWYNTSTGELNYDTSASKYKENIRDLTDTSWLYNLQPRLFDEKDGNRTDLTGLIAEEVELVNPELVYYKPLMKTIQVEEEDENGNIVLVDREVKDLENMEIEGVGYQDLIIPMLKEIQNLNSRINTLEGICGQ